MDIEIWKDILGYEGRYQASTDGHIRSVDRKVKGVNHYAGKIFYRTAKGKILRPGRYSKSGHLSVVLGRGNNGLPVHQLIARTFLGECPNGCEVLHGNGNPVDNRVENLRYGTRTENILDVYKNGGRWRKMSVDDVKEIRAALSCGFSGKELSKRYKVSQTTISCIKRGKTFSWLK